MECFTFLRIGGALERIEVSMIAHPDENPAEARQELKAQFASFDAAKAECFLPKDRHRLLAIVEAGFGDFKVFNQRVRSIFDDRLHEASSRREGPKASTRASRREPRTLGGEKTLVPEARVQPEETAGASASKLEGFDSTSGAALASSAAPATAKVAPA